MRTDSNSYRRDYLRALAQRVQVDAKELRIMGSKSALLRTLVGASGAKTAQFGTEVAHATRFERLAFSNVWPSPSERHPASVFNPPHARAATNLRGGRDRSAKAAKNVGLFVGFR
ncbi:MULTISPECIES: hypothetical protein [unclassified Bradyrhizobium]|uniref:hypothetical protein n=1 Tax=unclassified Bradyrhizobium TaxID=2631580 RepID=UPI00291601AB|nr:MULTISPECIES: hypothetical protein [unclassified Bradyrhizobium]